MKHPIKHPIKHLIFFIRYLFFFQSILLLLLYYEIGLALLRIVSPSRAVTFLNRRLGRNGKSLLGIAAVFLGLVPQYINTPKQWNIPHNKQFIILSNHQSILDPLIIASMFDDYPIRFVLKKALSKNFVYVSALGRTQKHGFVDRNNPAQAIKSVKALAQYTKEHNYPIVVFPEGTRTRSKDGTMRAFKVAGLKTLLRNNPMPVVVVGTHNGYHLPTFVSFRPFKRDRIVAKILRVYPEVSMKESQQILDESYTLIKKQIEIWQQHRSPTYK